MNVAICGLTAAGKTTHGLLLAETLGFSYISAAEILRELAGVDLPSSREMWFSQFERLEAAPDRDQVDDALEERLKALAKERTDVVFDAWALPWLTDAPMVRVWIESDRQSRYWKCFMSQSEPRKLSIPQCAEHVDAKDSSTRARFARRHHFDLYRDHKRFDLVLENTTLITAPTDDAVREGIMKFRGYFESAVQSVLRGDPAPLYGFIADREHEAAGIIRRTPFQKVTATLSKAVALR